MPKSTNAIEDVLSARFAEDGWGGLQDATDELTAEAQHAAQLQRFETAMEIARPFLTPDGKLALSKLQQRTTDAPTWSPEATGAMEGAAAGFAREGQNSIIRFISDCIRVAMEGPPHPIATGADTP